MQVSDVNSASNLKGTLAASLRQHVVPPFTFQPSAPSLDPAIDPMKAPPQPSVDVRPGAPGTFIQRSSGNGVRVNTSGNATGDGGGPSVPAVRIVNNGGDVKTTVGVTGSSASVSATTSVGGVTVNASASVNPTRENGVGVDPTPLELSGRVTVPIGPVGVYGQLRSDQIVQRESGGTTTEVGVVFNPSGKPGDDDSARGLVGVTAGVTTASQTSKTGDSTSVSVPFVAANTSVGKIGVDGRVTFPEAGPNLGLTLFTGDSRKGGAAALGLGLSSDGQGNLWIGYANNNL